MYGLYCIQYESYHFDKVGGNAIETVNAMRDTEEFFKQTLMGDAVLSHQFLPLMIKTEVTELQPPPGSAKLWERERERRDCGSDNKRDAIYKYIKNYFTCECVYIFFYHAFVGLSLSLLQYIFYCIIMCTYYNFNNTYESYI